MSPSSAKRKVTATVKKGPNPKFWQGEAQKLSNSYIVRQGDPASWIISEAEKEPDTLIAMSTHGRSRIGRWLLGSVIDR